MIPAPTKADIALADAYDAWRGAEYAAKQIALTHGVDSRKASKARGKTARLRLKFTEVADAMPQPTIRAETDARSIAKGDPKEQVAAIHGGLYT